MQAVWAKGDVPTLASGEEDQPLHGAGKYRRDLRRFSMMGSLGIAKSQ